MTKKIAKPSVILSNCACWHQRQSEIHADPKARARHEEIADVLWMRAYRMRQAGQ